MKRHSRLLALLLCILLVLTALAGCGAQSGAPADAAATSDSATTENTASAPAYDGGTEAYPETAPTEDTAATEEGLSGSSGVSVVVPDAGDISDKLIYTANLTVETTQFDDTVSQIEDLVNTVEGFVESSNVSGNTRYDNGGDIRVVDRYANYTLRVPSQRFQEALDLAQSIGYVTSANADLQNVSSQYTDMEARKASLETQEQRLLELLGQSGDLEALITLEERLADVRYEIDSIERNLRNLDTDIAYSTIYLDLYEVAVYTPTAPVQRTFGERLSDSLRSGWNGFVNAMKSLILFVASSLPALILLAVVIVVVIVVIRRRRRQARASAEQKPEKPDEPKTP